MLQQARQAKGLTQAQLAELSGTNKSSISKLENDLKGVRLSTLQRIIAEGLGGHLESFIKFWYPAGAGRGAYRISTESNRITSR